MRYLIALLTASFLLSGCTTIIKPENIVGADRLLTPSEVMSNASIHKGKKVLWGGIVKSNFEHEGVSILELTYLPVDQEGIPQNGDHGEDAYLVETNEFLQPDEYHSGRYITLSGDLIGIRTVRKDGKDITAPAVSPREIYLWDRSKFSRKTRWLDENPYADTYMKPAADRPLDAVKDPKILR